MYSFIFSNVYDYICKYVTIEGRSLDGNGNKIIVALVGK